MNREIDEYRMLLSREDVLQAAKEKDWERDKEMLEKSDELKGKLVGRGGPSKKELRFMP